MNKYSYKYNSSMESRQETSKSWLIMYKEVPEGNISIDFQNKKNFVGVAALGIVNNACWRLSGNGYNSLVEQFSD